MRVRDLMTDAVKTATPSTRLEDVARLMRDEDIGSVPVAENEKLVGMVTDRDIVIRGLAESASLEGKCVRDVMSPQVLYCREDQTVEDVLKNMGEQQIRRLPVVDESKRLVGVVSLGDLSTRARVTKTGEALKEISRPTVRSRDPTVIRPRGHPGGAGDSRSRGAARETTATGSSHPWPDPRREDSQDIVCRRRRTKPPASAISIKPAMAGSGTASSPAPISPNRPCSSSPIPAAK